MKYLYRDPSEWLAGALHEVDFPSLARVIESLEGVENLKYPQTPLYRRGIVTKGGKRRGIHVPVGLLMKIQIEIDRRILRWLPVMPNTFGFSGGSIDDTINPHLKSQFIWTCDIMDAFPSISRTKVASNLRRQFSRSASELLALLCTAPPGWRLPQGAPTSPRLFDQCMHSIDLYLSELAEHLHGIYTRYADNLVFSGTKEVIGAAEEEILGLLQMAELTAHKIQWGDLASPNAIKTLGLNLMEQKVHNTRKFKRGLRLAIHHAKWLLDQDQGNTPQFKRAMEVLRGKMGFTKITTIPTKTLEAYMDLELRLT